MHRSKFVSAIALISLSALARPAAAADVPFEVYGFAQADYIQDFKRVDPAWEDTLRPSRIATTPGEFGTDGQAVIGARQSRLGVNTKHLLSGHTLDTKFEFDMFGVAVDEGQTTIRLRHAYGQWGPWLGGQTHSLFMDIDLFPNTIDYWGPSGMAFLRTPQLRWTPLSGDTSFAIAIEKATDDIDAGQIRQVAPELGANITPDEKLPDLTAQFRSQGKWGHISISGIARRIGFDTAGTPDNAPKGFKPGWGTALGSSWRFAGKEKLILGALYGHGIASYMNDGGTDLAPEGSPGALSPKAVPLLGIIAYYDHYWSDLYSTSFGYSRTQVENTSFQAADAFKTGEYASVNVLHTPAKNTMMGVEFLWGRRIDKGGDSGNDFRTQVSFKYNFSSKETGDNK